MQALSNAASAVSSAIFGSDNTQSGEEPKSGETGKGTAEQPYDAGNQESGYSPDVPQQMISSSPESMHADDNALDDAQFAGKSTQGTQESSSSLGGKDSAGGDSSMTGSTPESTQQNLMGTPAPAADVEEASKMDARIGGDDRTEVKDSSLTGPMVESSQDTVMGTPAPAESAEQTTSSDSRQDSSLGSTSESTQDSLMDTPAPVAGAGSSQNAQSEAGMGGGDLSRGQDSGLASSTSDTTQDTLTGSTDQTSRGDDGIAYNVGSFSTEGMGSTESSSTQGVGSAVSSATEGISSGMGSSTEGSTTGGSGSGGHHHVTMVASMLDPKGDGEPPALGEFLGGDSSKTGSSSGTSDIESKLSETRIS